MNFVDFQSTPQRAPFYITDEGDQARMYGTLAEMLTAFDVCAGPVRVTDGYGNVWFDGDPLDPNDEEDFDGMEVLSTRLREYEAEVASLNAQAEQYEGNLKAALGDSFLSDLLDVDETEILSDERGIY